MEALTALFEERKRYEGWLAQIDSRRASTPAHVFERVRGDYSARLQRVIEQLTGRSSELQTTATTLAEQIATLFATETSLRDDRAEAELRASVGEYTDEDARAIYVRCDEEIASLESQRKVLGTELAKVQEVLTLIAPRPAPVPEPEPVAVVEEVELTVTAEVPVPAPVPEAPAAAPGFDDLAFLHSIVEPQAATPQRHAEPAATRPAPSQRAEDTVLPQSVLNAARRAGGGPPANPVDANRGPLHSTLTPGTLPAFLKDMPTEQIKTLKCTECGTMNYPTEWYCERCGGELAAM
jgi:hypothetical protein